MVVFGGSTLEGAVAGVAMASRSFRIDVSLKEAMPYPFVV